MFVTFFKKNYFHSLKHNVEAPTEKNNKKNSSNPIFATYTYYSYLIINNKYLVHTVIIIVTLNFAYICFIFNIYQLVLLSGGT